MVSENEREGAQQRRPRSARTSRSRTTTALRAIDAALGALLLVQMLQQYQSSTLHAWLGAAFCALLIAHAVLHRRWFAALTYGGWTALRAVQTAAVALCLAYGAALAVSGACLSGAVIDLMGWRDGGALAQRVHLMASYGGLAAFALHVGIQAHMRMRRMRKKRVSLSSPQRALTGAAALLVAVAGAACFAHLDLWTFITGAAHFAFVDTSVPAPATLLEFVLAGAMIAELGYALACVASIARTAPNGNPVPHGRSTR